MYNSTFKSAGTGLKRTAFKTKSDAKGLSRKTGLAPVSAKKKAAAPRARSTLKTTRPATTKIRQSANGEYCRLRLFGVCREEEGNVVWAHSNRGADGKAAGLKADDERGAYACYFCHCVYDRQHPRPPGMTLEYVEGEFTRAMDESTRALQGKGLIPRLPPPHV